MVSPVIIQTISNAVMLSAFYVLIAMGFALILSIFRMVNFAHGSMYMVGAFCIYLLVAKLGLNYFLGMAVSVVVMFAVGWLVEAYVVSRVRGDIFVVIIVTLGLMMLLESGVILIFGGDPHYLSSPVTGIVHLGGAVFSWERVLPTVVAIMMVASLWLFLQRTKSGMALRATSQNEDAAALQGINVEGIGNLTWGIGTALAAGGGVLMAPIFGAVPTMGGVALWKSLIIIIIGGFGSIPGCVLGGLLLGFTDSFATTFINPTSSMIIGFIFIIIILIVRPQGFMGAKET